MAQAIDYVCGMTVDTETSISYKYKETIYYFCCDGCKGAFEKASEYYIEEFKSEHPDQI